MKIAITKHCKFKLLPHTEEKKRAAMPKALVNLKITKENPI